MYGHATDLLTPCTACPPSSPHWASAIADDGRLICARCALEREVS